tara:strand:- start:175 stop:855 length:681 start_codon:yes stop_codon:yes gene_type:complete
LLFPLYINSVYGRNIDNQYLSNQLEQILNQKKYELIKNLFLEKSFKKFEKNYRDFRKKYKNISWSIQTISKNEEKVILDVKIKSKREIGDQIYNLDSKQIIQVETLNNKIKSYKVIKEESILKTENSPLIIKIISPDQVFTGEKYEFNLIIEKPLDDALIASGIIIIKNKDDVNILNDQFGIKPNMSGGLFKYIQAPLEPGFQTISAMVAHPKGIYSITKKIKVGL